MRRIKSPGDICFDLVNGLIMVVLIILTLYPFLYVVFASFSDPAVLGAHRGLLLSPMGFEVLGYRLVFQNGEIWTGYANTIFYVLIGTALNLLFTSMLAYTLSKKCLMLNGVIMFMVVFSMYFSGGMIPTYLMMGQIGLMGTRGAVILPGLVTTMNVIIMRTNFQSIPDSLEEAARLDGANEIQILWKVVLPLSMPVVVVMILFYGVGHWNAWFDAMLYLRDRSKFPLQLILREILIYSSTTDMMTDLGTNQQGQDMSQVIKYATTIVATVPVLLVYPFLQKYFVKGVMIGAIKG